MLKLLMLKLLMLKLLMLRKLLLRRQRRLILTLHLTMRKTLSRSPSTRPVASKSPRSGMMLSTFGRELSIPNQ